MSANSGDGTNDSLFGEIRSVRYSIEKLFGATTDILFSSNSSVVSSSASTNAKKLRTKRLITIRQKLVPFLLEEISQARTFFKNESNTKLG